MKSIIILLALVSAGCATNSKSTYSSNTTVQTQRTVAGSTETVVVKTNRNIQPFRNTTSREQVISIGEISDTEVEYKSNNYSCLFHLKTPAKTNGYINSGRIFYAKMGDCRVFSKYERAPNYCTAPVLHLFNSKDDVNDPNKEPVAFIDARVPGNPTTVYPQYFEEYVDLIKGCFDMDTADKKSELTFKTMTDKAL